MGLSIILSTAGNDQLRVRNLKECLACIDKQTYRDFEVIVVEQNLDGHYYNHWVKKDLYLTIEDPLKRGFNLAWCRNVGARKASKDIIVLMDGDFVFDEGYFQRISEMNPVFAGGAEKYLWSNENQVQEWYRQSKRVSAFEPHWIGWRSLDWERGVGYGAILIFNRDWFWNVMGGGMEDLFKYGWEDRQITFQAMRLLGLHESQVQRIPGMCVHLNHGNKDYLNNETNHQIYERSKLVPMEILSERLKQMGVGDVTSPKVLGI